MATSRLQFSCIRTNRRAMGRLVSLPLWRGCLVIYAQVSSLLQDLCLAFHWTTRRKFIWSWPRFVCRSPANGRNGGRHGQLSPFLLGNVPCLHCQQVYSRLQAIRPSFLMTISSLLGCGLCTGGLSEVFRYLLPGEGKAPARVWGAGTTSRLQKVVLDPISGHDLSRHADPVSSVHCNSDSDVGRKTPQDYRGVSFIPGPPSCSLASSSGPPFVSYSSGKGWDVKDAMFPDSPQVLVGLRDEFLRIPWDPLYKEDPLWWSWATRQREGVDLSLPVPDLSFYSDESDVGWGVIVGEHQVSGVWSPSQRGLSINLREMMAVQGGLLEFSSLLRGRTIALFCDIVTTVAYLRRSGGTRSQDLFLEAREILLWVESIKITLLPQLIRGSLNTRADLLSRPNLMIGSDGHYTRR